MRLENESNTGGAAHLGECLSSMHDALGSIPRIFIKQAWWFLSLLRKWRQEDEKFKFLVG